MHALEGRGYTVLHCPAFALDDYPDITARLVALHGARRIIVTSPAAARSLVRHAPPGLLEAALLLAPGPGTARVLEAAGHEVAVPVQAASSEALLALPELCRPAGTRVGIIAAPGGRTLLAEQLARRGAEVVRIEVYRRRGLAPSAPVVEALAGGRRLRVVASSVGIVEHLDDAIPASLRDAWRGGWFIVSSERVAGACRRRGAGHVVTADGPSAQALLAAVERSG